MINRAFVGKRRILKFVVFLGLTCFINVKSVNAITIFGDVNGDNKVDKVDLDTVSSKYGTNYEAYDFNKDSIVDIYDISALARNINNYNFKVYDSQGIFKNGFFTGNLRNAIQQAKLLNGGFIINDSGQVVWDKNSYWVYDGEQFKNKYNTMYTAMNAGDKLQNGLVINKAGNIFLDKAIGYKKVLGVAQYALNLRPTASYSSGLILEIPTNGLIELEGRNLGFYKVKYFDNNTNKTLDGYVTRYVDIFSDDNKNSFLGYVSEKYESNGDPGTISSGVGDYGGVSYGAWQLSSKLGSLDEFIIWLKNENSNFYNLLNNAKIQDGGTFGTNFNSTWKSIATNNYGAFYEAQHKFTKIRYYDDLVARLNKSGINYGARLENFSVRNVLWSTAVQHGAYGAYNIINKYSSITNPYDFLGSIYDERSRVEVYFRSSSIEVQQGVKNRFIKEKADAQRIYLKETTY